MGRQEKSSAATAQASTNLLTKVLALVGKPLYLFFYLFLFLLLQLFVFASLIIDFLIKKTSLFFTVEKLKKKGIIYSSTPLSAKPLFKNLRLKVTNLKKSWDGFWWNLSVFVMASRKLVYKLKTPKKPEKEKFVASQKQHFPIFNLFRIPKLPLLKVVKGISFVTLVAVVVFCFWFWQVILKDLPTPQELTQRKFSVSTKIYDRSRELLYTIYKDQKRTPVVLSEIPIQARLATVAAEDKEFYTHSGFSVRGILRAIFKDLREGRVSGGSTITQQLVKNALLSSEKTITRKLKEIVLSIQVERAYGKDQILEMYLNEVPYGGTAYGIEEAANTFFDKKVGDLTLAESALLAGLPQSPTKYSPFAGGLESALGRQSEILGRMVEKGFITSEQKSAAENENINFAKSKVIIKAPHFVFYVRDILEAKYGKEVVEQGGLEVVTSLDYQIQKLAENVVSEELEKLKSLNVTNASVVVMDPKTGEILAMVGSNNFFDMEKGGNVNVATRPRQPGSSIKVVNYAYALSNGLTPATIIPDTPETFEVEDQPPYTPKNYEGDFRGNITLRSALAESRNIPAVKLLASYGVKKMMDFGTKMGITTWEDPDRYGLSLTLGGGEVKLLDLARVYSTLANYGKRPELTSILSTKDYQNSLSEEFACETEETSPDNPVKVVKKENKKINLVNSANATESALVFPDEDQGFVSCGEQVIDPRVAFLITDILKDNNARSPSFGSNSLLNINKHPEVAVKTGTSNDLRDNLAIGYTQDYVVAVWIGNNDNSEMSRISSGVTGATPIFNKIMTALLNDREISEWTVPQGLKQVSICPITGTLSCEGCPNKSEWFLEETIPDRACNSEWFKNLTPSVSPGPDNKREDLEDRIEREVERLKRRLERRD